MNFGKMPNMMPNIFRQMSVYWNFARQSIKTTNHSVVLAFIQTPHIRSSRQSFSCLWRARLPRIFPFTFYSGKQEGILVAVQTRSPIARGNWVDIGNESKEQITRSKGRRALR